MLTEKDSDHLYTIMVVAFHTAEIAMRGMEKYFRGVVEQSDEYKQICKQYGKASADATVYFQTHKIMMRDEKTNVGRLLSAFERVEHYMEQLTEYSVSSCQDKTQNVFQRQETLDRDARFYGRVMCYLANLRFDKTDEQLRFLDLQIESTLKNWKHKELLSDAVRECFAVRC